MALFCFQGSELVVVGRLKRGAQQVKVALSASDAKRKMRVERELEPPVVTPTSGEESGRGPTCPGVGPSGASFVRRLWAYFTIKELLLARTNSSEVGMQRLLTEKATNLSLAYNFVTPVTSLVVVKPDVDEAPTTTPKPTTSASTSSSSVTTTPKSTTSPSGRSTTTTQSPPQGRSSSTSPKASNKQPPRPTLTLPPRPQPPPGGLHTTGRPSGPAAPPAAPPSAPLSPRKTTTTITTITTTLPSSSAPSSKPTTSAALASLVKTTNPPPSTTSASDKTTAASSLASEPVKDSSTVGPDEGTMADVDPQQPPAAQPSPAENFPSIDLTLVAATFMPMPGVTDAPKPWEAAGLLGE